METSTSHHNIYNYPEHLNPFYEDEQHKRLRFWKFGSSRSKSKNSERRGSNFSLDTLKEMWYVFKMHYITNLNSTFKTKV